MSIDIVDAAMLKDAEGFKAAFDAALASKVSDALEVRKIEIASTLIATDEPPNEEEAEIVDGDAADGDAASTDTE